ncbi:MAG: alpha/beta fold hydrolase [Planctomycetia bacterium]|jgi:pimeloyl-[acyl-carrier protein] methyl ester esterase
MNQPSFQTEPHLYLIGGWGSDSCVWQPALEHLRDAPLTFSVVDWQEVLHDSQTLDRLLLAAQESEAAPRPILLVGWSLGGMLALEATLRHLDVVQGLLLIGSTARMCEAPDYPGVDPRMIRAMKRKLRTNPTGVLHDFAELCFTNLETGQVTDPEACEAYFRQSESCDDASLAAGLDYLLETDLREAAEMLAEEGACEVHFFHAETDAVVPYCEMEHLSDRLPYCTECILESNVHALPLAEPEQTATRILRFCKAVEEEVSYDG